MNTLKLYLWENVLVDHTPGVMLAFAHDIESARTMLRAHFKPVPFIDFVDGQYVHKIAIDEYAINEMMSITPKVISEPFAFHLYGTS